MRWRGHEHDQPLTDGTGMAPAPHVAAEAAGLEAEGDRRGTRGEPGSGQPVMKRARAGGSDAWRRRPPRGPRPKLTDAQKRKLLAILTRGAEAYQFRGDVWTPSGSRR